MLSFFKSKPALKDLIPQGYTDIHSHLLFGIDDGAKTLEDSNFLMESMRNMGFSKCITTPHTAANIWDNTATDIRKKKELLYEKSPQLTAQLKLEAASEYMINEPFIQLYETEPLLTLKEKYVLVEISYMSPPLGLYEILFGLQLAGYTPVLAHPERYGYFHHNFDEFKKLKKAGCLFQTNLLSAVGYYGSEVAVCAEKLLKKGLIDFTGSDVHHSKHIAAFSEKVLFKDNTALVEAMQNNSLFR